MLTETGRCKNLGNGMTNVARDKEIKVYIDRKLYRHCLYDLRDCCLQNGQVS